jgi:hypothetical protein
MSRALSLGVKWPDHEYGHSPPSSAEVKNVWSYTSTPPYVYMAWCLVKQRHNFTYTLPDIRTIKSRRKRWVRYENGQRMRNA